MHATRQWIEKVEASGLPWDLFFTLRSETVNKVLAEVTEARHSVPKNGPVKKTKDDLREVRSVEITKGGAIIFHHDDCTRRSPFIHIFVRELPQMVPWYCVTIWSDGVTRKRLDDALNWFESLPLNGLALWCLDVNKYGYLHHEITVGFQEETDAILFSASLTNTTHNE